MKPSLSRLVAACCLGLALAAPAAAQNHPSQPIKWIVPYSAGGGSDVTARVVSNTLKNSLGQNIVIDNRPGAGTIVGMQTLLTAKPDGCTVATADSGTFAYNPSLYA